MGQQRLATRVRENYVLPLLLLLPFPRKIPFWYICIGPLLKTHKFIWCSKQFCEAGFTQNPNCNFQSKTIFKIFFDSFLMLWFEALLKMFCRVVTDRTFGSAELLLCGSAQMTELFSAEHRTFFVLNSMPMASLWTTCTKHYYCFLGKIAKRMPTEPKLE